MTLNNKQVRDMVQELIGVLEGTHVFTYTPEERAAVVELHRLLVERWKREHPEDS